MAGFEANGRADFWLGSDACPLMSKSAGSGSAKGGCWSSNWTEGIWARPCKWDKDESADEEVGEWASSSKRAIERRRTTRHRANQSAVRIWDFRPSPPNSACLVGWGIGFEFEKIPCKGTDMRYDLWPSWDGSSPSYWIIWWGKLWNQLGSYEQFLFKDKRQTGGLVGIRISELGAQYRTNTRTPNFSLKSHHDWSCEFRIRLENGGQNGRHIDGTKQWSTSRRSVKNYKDRTEITPGNELIL